MKTNAKLMLAAAAMGGLLAGATSRAQAAMPQAPTSGSHVTARPAGSSASSAQAGTVLSRAMDSGTDKHDCKGKNDCKGKGGCSSGDNGCKGKNSCKAKGGCSTR
jgi:hypothetical protein